MKASYPRSTAALIRPLTALVFEFCCTPPFPGSAASSGTVGSRLWQMLLKSLSVSSPRTQDSIPELGSDPDPFNMTSRPPLMSVQTLQSILIGKIAYIMKASLMQLTNSRIYLQFDTGRTRFKFVLFHESKTPCAHNILFRFVMFKLEEYCGTCIVKTMRSLNTF